MNSVLEFGAEILALLIAIVVAIKMLKRFKPDTVFEEPEEIR